MCQHELFFKERPSNSIEILMGDFQIEKVNYIKLKNEENFNWGLREENGRYLHSQNCYTWQSHNRNNEGISAKSFS